MGAPAKTETRVDPSESPFTAPPVEGIPYERGSEEDEAVRRTIERAHRATDAAPAN